MLKKGLIGTSKAGKGLIGVLNPRKGLIDTLGHLETLIFSKKVDKKQLIIHKK